MSAYTERLSFQLYSARREPPLRDQLACLADLGVTMVETFGPLHDDPAATAALLSEFGLTAPSAHIGLDDLRADLGACVRLAGTLGAGIIVAPYLKAEARPQDRAGWRALGRELGSLADRLGAEGLRLAWHNHEFEMTALPDGSFPIEHLLSHQSVMWELDTAWIQVAGQDPHAWLTSYAGRVPLVHIKDIAASGHEDEDGWADVGYGIMPWSTLAPACLDAGAEVFILEHDKPGDYRRFARRSVATVRGW